jgi:hypothetical protein
MQIYYFKFLNMCNFAHDRKTLIVFIHVVGFWGIWKEKKRTKGKQNGMIEIKIDIVPKSNSVINSSKIY